MLATQNRYVRPLIPVVIGLVAVLVLLFVGGLLSAVRSGGGAVLNWGDILKWGSALLVGGVIAYALYYQFVEAPIWDTSTRVIVYSAIGAALYGVFSWATNVVTLPAISNVSLRPAIVIPVFFGFAFGPVAGFFTGFVGNILGDALTGWGVYPVWDIGNGLIGLVAGLSMAFKDKKRSLDVLTWVSVAVAVIATILIFINPTPVFASPLTGVETDFSTYWWVPLVGAVLVLAARYLLASRNIDAAAIAVWGTLGIIIGIGFAALLDIYVNGYTFFTAFIGEFVPAAGSNIINAVILGPILLTAWNAARAQSGR
jgi:uncharacterized membrane protein